ncbi:hypothetical protein N9T57_01365 [Paracoccaceae bacterium]|nr:hypothetical protein [Paracoccaceae bacterium]
MEKHNIRVREFLDLSNEAQFAWIKKNIPDYELKLYGDGYLGAYYPLSIDWDEYLNNREDYGVSGLIALKDNQLTNDRRREIDEGAPLTEIEKEFLANAIADEDHDSWITHNGFGITLSNGSVYILFEGHSLGPGGFDFKFFGTFDTYEKLLSHVTSQPVGYLE